MEDRGADAHQRRTEEEERIVGGIGEDEDPRHGEGHADRQRVGLGPAVGEAADERLEERARHLEGERQHAELDEVEPEPAPEQRIERGKQRLHRVVEEVADADRGENGERCVPRPATGPGDRLPHAEMLLCRSARISQAQH